MVKFIILWMLLAPIGVQAMTAEELRRIAGDAERAKRHQAERVQVTNLMSLLPILLKKREDRSLIESDLSDSISIKHSVTEANKNNKRHLVAISENNTDEVSGTGNEDRVDSTSYNAPKQIVATVSKYGTKNFQSENIVTEILTPTSLPVSIATPSHVYVAPARYKSSRSSSNTSDAVAVQQRRFGIRIGSWFSARMSRETTNADPGLIEILILEDVEGDFRTLPAGTILFSEKVFNQGTKRLDLRIVKGVLLDGEEIELDGLVYDASRVAGLHGIVVENELGVVSSGFKQGVISAGRVIASTAAGSSPAGVVLNSTVGAVADAKEEAVVMEMSEPYTIHVSPQAVLVQVQSTF